MLYFLCLVLLLDFRNGPQVEASLRLVGGSDSCSGRVEVLYNGVWGTVCDDNWDASDAAVVCRQLGCGNIVEAKSLAYFGVGSGPVWMDEVQCFGNENVLVNCPRPLWGDSNCGHGEDAGVICQASVRLVGGGKTCSGRVEVLYNGVWGTVCDNGWDLSDAAVVCRELNCGDPVEVKTGAYYGQGTGKIWMDNAQCTGSETSLRSCSATKWDVQTCGHSKDAGVICKPSIRVVNGPTCSGRVEVLHGGVWGTVCSDSWDYTDAVLACKDLGCPYGAEAKKYSYFEPGVGTIWMSNTQCTGAELSLKQCSFSGWLNNNCDHSLDAGVICRNFRLVNGGSTCSGRVETLNNDQWGTVCDAGWDITDAAVLCRFLDCGIPVEAKTGAFFGQGSGPVWLDDVKCFGNELTVRNCPSKALGTSTCGHEQDAGVICQEVKLVDGTTPCDGRVQVFYDGHWGSVCHTGWGLEEATVLCKALGCGAVVRPTSYAGPYNGPKWMDNLACTGNEGRLRNCPFTGYGVSSCGDGLYAGVICKNVKLVNGPHMCSGRVEVIYNYHWGTICDAGWNLTDAAVVCNSMDCGTPLEAKTGAFFGQGSGPVWLDDVKCSGKELTLRNCPSKALGTSTCSHGQDAGVICRDVKLVNGTSSCDGNILILNNAQWGAVCYNGWDLQDATVLCSELGCGEFPVPVPYVGTYNGPIWMDNLACTGKEWTVRDCPFTGYGVSRCVDGRYAGVTCIKFVRKNLLRIAVTVETGIYVNDPNIKKSIMDKISQVVRSKGNNSASWKTQRDGKVFHQIPR